MPNACTRPSLYVWVRVCGGPPCLCPDSVNTHLPTCLPTYHLQAGDRRQARRDGGGGGRRRRGGGGGGRDGGRPLPRVCRRGRPTAEQRGARRRRGAARGDELCRRHRRAAGRAGISTPPFATTSLSTTPLSPSPLPASSRSTTSLSTTPFAGRLRRCGRRSRSSARSATRRRRDSRSAPPTRRRSRARWRERRHPLSSCRRAGALPTHATPRPRNRNRTTAAQ